jgi:hypothetical protein
MLARSSAYAWSPVKLVEGADVRLPSEHPIQSQSAQTQPAIAFAIMAISRSLEDVLDVGLRKGSLHFGQNVTSQQRLS